jgi:hypothetical protein
VANESIPIYQPGEAVTGHCQAAVTGKRFLKLAADKQPGADAAVSDAVAGGNIVVAMCVAGDKCFGVADRDRAINEKVGVLGPGHITPVRAGAAVTAGQRVQSDASGQAIPLAAGADNGVAINSASTGEDVFVRVAD